MVFVQQQDMYDVQSACPELLCSLEDLPSKGIKLGRYVCNDLRVILCSSQRLLLHGRSGRGSTAALLSITAADHVQGGCGAMICMQRSDAASAEDAASHMRALVQVLLPLLFIGYAPRTPVAGVTKVNTGDAASYNRTLGQILFLLLLVGSAMIAPMGWAYWDWMTCAAYTFPYRLMRVQLSVSLMYTNAACGWACLAQM